MILDTVAVLMLLRSQILQRQALCLSNGNTTAKAVCYCVKNKYILI